VIAYDEDARIIAMLSASKENPLEVAEAVKNYKYNREDYKRCMELLKNCGENSNAEVAAAEFAMIYMSRDGMAGEYQRLKPCLDKKEDVRSVKEKWQEERESKKMHEQISCKAIRLHYALQNIELICDNFLKHMEHWEDVHTFNYLDVPYLYCKRGFKGKRKNTGYRVDWSNDDHEIFLNRIMELYYAGRLKGKLMICSNFEMDENGGLIGLEDDLYNKKLLETGAFRLVVTERKHACEGNDKRRAKAEVVWINYTDILGCWENYQYYDKIM